MSKATCEANTFCEGGKSNRNVFKRNPTECTACGGSVVPEGKWMKAEWMEPAMVNGNKRWLKRAMEQSNTWVNQIDRWRLKDALRAIQDSIQETFDSVSIFAIEI